jgi:hypothetical protein
MIREDGIVNLFWNKALRDVLMASTRSVGWNAGNLSGNWVAPPQTRYSKRGKRLLEST